MSPKYTGSFEKLQSVNVATAHSAKGSIGKDESKEAIWGGGEEP